MVKKLLVFASGGMMDPATRMRAYYMAKYLLKNDFETKVFFYESVKGSIIKRSLYAFENVLTKIGAVIRSESEVLVYIQRGIGSSPQLSLIFSLSLNLALRKRTIFDIDDALFLTNPFATNNIIRNSDLVIVGGHELLNYVKKYNKNTFLIPTSADLNRYLPHNIAHESDGVKLGFVGSPSTNNYLKLMLKPLTILAKSYDLELRVISARSHGEYKPFSSLFRSFERNGVRVKLIPWSLKDEYYQLRFIDIGLAPLIDDEWERYKCGFKVINYMAAGIPPVASKVGEHCYIIQDGFNGFLCRDDQEWTEKLKKLLDDETLRKNMGLNARKTVKERYSMEKNAKTLAEILTKLC
jgi:glycosyltransferase involved in cell wall biosynthesis